MDVFCPKLFQMKLLAVVISIDCLIIVKLFIMDFLIIPSYTQHHLLWRMFSTQFLSRSISLTDLLKTALNIVVKNPFLITSKKPIQKRHLKFCEQWLERLDKLLVILWRQVKQNRFSNHWNLSNLCRTVVGFILNFSLTSLMIAFAVTTASKSSFRQPSL